MIMNIERIKNLLKSVAPKPLLVYGKTTPGTFYPAIKPLHDGDFVKIDLDDNTGLTNEEQEMTRIDHAKEARRALRAAAETPSDVETVADPWILSAQVHATLALVEQQRIANLIALWQGSPAQDARNALVAYREHENSEQGGWFEFHPEINAALGIGVSE